MVRGGFEYESKNALRMQIGCLENENIMLWKHK